jgi:4-hydroxysphinganine ceramide fatty acyl 2-hydroxylase
MPFGESPALRTISASEVAGHRSEKSLWAVFKGRVFDVTSFLADHPGGPDFILDAVRERGGDVGPAMLDPLVHSHSDSAFDMLEGMCIGILEGSDEPAGKARNGAEPSKRRLRDLSEPEEDIRETHKSLGVARADFVDPAKPMLAQVFLNNYPKKVYLEQVHIPRHVSGSAPIFGNFLEPLTKTPWWVVPLVWLPFGQAHTLYAYHLGLSIPALAFFWTVGIVVWTLIEYSLHRWLFHVDRLLPDNRFATTIHFLMHGIHHFLPMDKLVFGHLRDVFLI